MSEQDNPSGAAPASPQPPAAPKPPWEEKAVAPVPHDALEHAQVKEFVAAVPGAVIEAVEFAGQVTVTVDRERIVEIGRACKETLGYAFLVDLTAVDWQDRPEGRFDVVYWMHRHADSVRLRLKLRVGVDAEVPSVTGVWKVADWMEREVFDMFGIRFAGHPNLKRILMPEEFTAFPLRKDYPLRGRGERHNFPVITRAES